MCRHQKEIEKSYYWQDMSPDNKPKFMYLYVIKINKPFYFYISRVEIKKFCFKPNGGGSGIDKLINFIYWYFYTNYSGLNRKICDRKKYITNNDTYCIPKDPEAQK